MTSEESKKTEFDREKYSLNLLLDKFSVKLQRLSKKKSSKLLGTIKPKKSKEKNIET